MKGWYNANMAGKETITRELLDILKMAVARIELANAEGDDIMSAWLPDAKAVIAKVKGE